MPNVQATVTGAKEVARRLQQMGAGHASRATAASLHAAALLIQNEAKRLAPKKTRTLSRSITTEVVAVGGTRFEARVGPSAPYGKYLEFGTGIYAEGGNGRRTPWVFQVAPGKFVTTKGMRPRPYMRPALDTKKDAAVREFRRVFLAAITRTP